MSIVVNFVGDRLRRVRMAAGLNGKELANKAGISPAYLTQLEKNKRTPSPELLIKLAETLSVPVDSFGLPAPDSPAVRETPATYGTDAARIAELEAELATARETIYNLSVALSAAGRAAAAPASGASGGGLDAAPAAKRERKLGAS